MDTYRTRKTSLRVNEFRSPATHLASTCVTAAALYRGDWSVASCIPPYQSHGLAADRRTRARIVYARAAASR